VASSSAAKPVRPRVDALNGTEVCKQLRQQLLVELAANRC
jgi:hypothetical protein